MTPWHNRFWVFFILALNTASQAAEPIALGSRRELFVDDFLIERLEGKAELRLHHPEPQEVVLVHDAPWEGNACCYHSVFQDGKLYRMFYRGWTLEVVANKLKQPHIPVSCYAESPDGLHWKKPTLGLVAFNGSKENNIVLTSGPLGDVTLQVGEAAYFKDENPDSPPEARYKALVLTTKPLGLMPFQSGDALHWTPMSPHPVITQGAFDSQNLAFWDPLRREYRAYYRFFKEGVRDIRTSTSKDFLHWSDPVDLEYPDAPREQLYTNQIKPYYRAPHLFLGFPTRYMDRGWTESTRNLPDPGHREQRAQANPRYGTAVTEALFMTSRDGQLFHRWNDAFLRPGIERPGAWNYGQQFIAWQLVETGSTIPGAPNELSLYATESYWTGKKGNLLRRYRLRMDGFVSVHAPRTGGELITKPFTFAGSELTLNVATAAAGGVQVELQDAQGQPIPGFTLADCNLVFGDSLARHASWKQGKGVGSQAGKPVRLRLHLEDADLFSFQFRGQASRK
jgi:hypothetical protein